MPAIPGTPVNFQIQEGNGEIYLTWNLSAGATSYQVQRSTDGVTFTIVASPATNSYLDSAVVLGTQYFYQIASTNVNGTSPYTSPQSQVPTLTGIMTLGQLRLLSQQKADRVNSQFVTVPEWNTYINQSYFELYDLLITEYEDYYVAPPIQFTTNGTTVQYQLPNGIVTFFDQNNQPVVAPPFYKLMGVDCGLGTQGNAWVTVKKFEFISRNRYVYPNISSTFLGVFNLQYRLVGDTLMFIPTPAGNQTIRLWYIPKLAQLLKDTDTVDGVSGWTEYIAVDAAIKALQKEESDVSVLMAQKEALIKRIEDSAMNRDVGQPDVISNTRTWSERWGGYGGPGFDGNFGGY